MADSRITYTLEVDATGLRTGVAQATQSLDQLQKKVQDNTRTEKGLIEDIIGEMERLKQARNRAQSTDEITKYNKKLQEAKYDLEQYEKAGVKSFSKVKSETSALERGLKSMLTAMIAAFSIDRVIAFGKAAFAAYEQQIRAERRLLNALDGRKSAQSELITQSQLLQKITGIEDDVILQVQTLAATHNLTTQEIKKVTEAALNLASVLGVDANTAAMQLLQTYEGQIGRLGKLDGELKNLTIDQLRNGEAVDLLLAKYKGFAQVSALAADKAKVAWREITETIGKGIFTVLETPLTRLAGALDELNTSQSDRIKEQVSQYKSLKDIDDAILKNQYDQIKTNEKINYITRNNEGLSKAALKVKLQSQRDNLQYLYDEQIELAKLKTARMIAANEEKKQATERATAQQELINQIRNASNEELGDLKKKYAGEDANLKLIEAEIDRRKQLSEDAKRADEEREKELQRQQEAYQKLQAAMTKFRENSIKLQAAEADGFEKIRLEHIVAINEIADQFGEIVGLAAEAGTDVGEEFVMEFWRVLDQQDEATAKKIRAFIVQDFEDGIKKLRDEYSKGFQKLLEGDIARETADKNRSSIFAILGIDPEDEEFDKKKQAIIAAFGEIASSIQTFSQMRVEAAAANVAAADEELRAAEEYYQQRKDLLEQGVNIDLEAEQRRLNGFREKRKAALEEEERQKKNQMVIDSAVQASQLISATAKYFEAYAGLPFIGQVLSIAAIGAMWTSFIAAKAKALELTKFEEGGKVAGEKLQGKRHSQGGIPIEAEGGEWIINRDSSTKYDGLLKAINEDNRHAVMMSINGLTPSNKILSELNKPTVNIELTSMKTELNAIKDEVKGLRTDMKQTGQVTTVPGAMIVQKGNHKRIYRQ